MKKSHIFGLIACLAMFVAVAFTSQGSEQKVVAKTELVKSDAVVPFQVVNMVYISSPTEEVIPWYAPDTLETICKGYLTQVFRPPIQNGLNRVASFSEHRS